MDTNEFSGKSRGKYGYGCGDGHVEGCGYYDGTGDGWGHGSGFGFGDGSGDCSRGTPWRA